MALAGTEAKASNVGLAGTGCVFGTIQQAIDWAPPGATVYVLPGTYNEDLVVDKDLDFVVADTGCLAAGAGNAVVSGPSPLTVTSGAYAEFRSFGFRDAAGAGIFANGSTVKLIDSTVFNSAARGIKGVEGGSLLLFDSTVLLNDGGGVSWEDGFVYMSNTNITRNTASDGGGVLVEGGQLTVVGTSTIHNNEAHPASGSLGGGCIAAYGAGVIVAENAEVFDCEASASGGGGAVAGGAMLLVDANTAIRGNAEVRDSDATGHGGLLFVDGGTLEIEDNARLSGGDSDAMGGNLYVTGGAVATLGGPGSDVRIQSGRAAVGGGIAVVGDDLPSMDEDRGGYGATATIASAVGGVEVLDNTALSDGGGVFVSGAIWEQTGTGSFVGGDDTSMPNRAERGGGIFVEGFGKVLLGDPDDSSDWVGLNPPDGFPIDGAQVRYNAATKAGGGLYVNGTGGVFGSGAAIFHNKAMGAGSGDGGGLAVWGALGWVELHSSVVSRNRARIYGGGAYVFDDGELLMKAVDNPDPEADPCAAFAQPDYYCSELRNNQAGRPATGTTGIGGAVYVGHGAAAEVVRTALVGNRSQQDAAHLYIAPGARADVQGSLVADAIVDADWPVSRGVMNEGRLSSRFSTYGGDGTTVVYGVGSQGEFFGNVVFPDGGVGGGLSVLPLLIQPLSLLPAYNTGTLSGSLFSTTNVDPLFTTTSRGYYRLGGGSPAVDQGSYPGVTPLLDLDLCSRPSGLDYDHGALETGTCP